MTRDDDGRPRQAFLGVEYRKSGNGDLSYFFSPRERWVKLMAEVGDAESQYDLRLDLSFYSAKKQKEEAVSWFRKAAEQGHAEAEYHLGRCYRDGEGVAPDLSEAIRWFEKAAEQNNPDALFNLGFLYYAGKGIKRDWKKARGLLERAVEADKDGWSNGAGDKARKCLREMDENG